MHILDLFTILCLALMTGNELAVSCFVNPAIWQLDESPQAQALSLLARSLGKVMPFWYVLCLVLLTVEAYVRRNGPHAQLLQGAVVLWIITIVYTISTPGTDQQPNCPARPRLAGGGMEPGAQEVGQIASMADWDAYRCNCIPGMEYRVGILGSQASYLLR